MMAMKNAAKAALAAMESDDLTGVLTAFLSASIVVGDREHPILQVFAERVRVLTGLDPAEAPFDGRVVEIVKQWAGR